MQWPGFEPTVQSPNHYTTIPLTKVDKETVIGETWTPNQKGWTSPGGSWRGMLKTGDIGDQLLVADTLEQVLIYLLSRSLGGCRGTNEADQASCLHDSLSVATLRSCSLLIPIHSLKSAPQVLYGLPLPLPPGTIPCSTVFAKLTTSGYMAKPFNFSSSYNAQEFIVWACCLNDSRSSSLFAILSL